MKYICPKCGEIYDELPLDKMCPKHFGVMLEEYIGESVEGWVNPPAAEPEETVDVIRGLCLLVCDASFSMDKPAFPDAKDEKIKELSKMKMVTDAVHQAIVELDGMSMPESAFVGILAFGEKARVVKDPHGRPFMASVRELTTGLGDKLGDYLFDCFQNDTPGVNRKHTDISAALQLARDIYDAALSRDLSRFDMRKGVKILTHGDIKRPGQDKLTAPNVRVMLYSDGQHNPKEVSALTNPFSTLYPSPLMTAFLGNEKASKEALEGANQLNELATICPTHGRKGFFLINVPDRHAVLRNLFRMATKHSGFCSACLIEEIGTEEEERSHYV